MHVLGYLVKKLSGKYSDYSIDLSDNTDEGKLATFLVLKKKTLTLVHEACKMSRSVEMSAKILSLTIT